MDLLENFILFDHSGGKTVKIPARNHQYLGVNEAVESYKARKLKDGKLGVFWLTQGSGKSYSMVFFAQKVRRKFAGSPTFVILTDRDELNKQISDTFEACGCLSAKASTYIPSSGNKLREKLKGNPSYIFTLIQKFNDDTEAPITPDHDIIILSDEAHRSQNGIFADTIAANIDTVSNLLQDRWDTLDLNEKANTLQTVANIEASYLGLPHELNVKIDTLRESTIAQYDDRTHTITVSITYLESMPAEEMLDSICHESYHAYQHRLIDAYNSVDVEYRDLLTFYFVPIYEEEFQNYVDGKDDDLAYYFQMCEMKARDYAEESVIDYYEKIEMYTSDEAYEVSI